MSGGANGEGIHTRTMIRNKLFRWLSTKPGGQLDCTYIARETPINDGLHKKNGRLIKFI